jgi:hypothetical protein
MPAGSRAAVWASVEDLIIPALSHRGAVSAAVGFVWGAIAILMKAIGKGLKWMADHNKCIGVKVYTIRNVPVSGYAYVSSYACKVGE